jgi:amino acid transporter
VTVLVAVLGTIACLATLAVTVLVLVITMRVLRDSWRRLPRERRLRPAVSIGIFLVLVVAMSSLMVIAPWGRRSALYVLGVSFGICFAGMLLFYVGLVVNLIAKSRRHRAQRRSASS